MAYKLPPLLFNSHTRVGLEALIYYNFGKAHLLGKLVKTAGGNLWMPEASCANISAPPPGGFQAARAANAMGAAVTLGGEVGPPIVAADAYIDYPPIGAAVELGTLFVPEDFADYPFVANAGDTVEIWSLPDPANDKLFCYDRGFTATEGSNRKAIPRKFNAADHYVPQRGENTLSMSDLFVNNAEGLSSLKGRDVTVKVVWLADGATPTEIDYFTNVQFTSLPANVPGDDNESVTVAAEGTFGSQLRFSSTRPAP